MITVIFWVSGRGIRALKPFISEAQREAKKARWKELLKQLLKLRI